MTDSLTRVIDLKKLRDEENYRSGVIRKGVEPEVIDDVLQREEVCRKYSERLRNFVHSKMLLQKILEEPALKNVMQR